MSMEYLNNLSITVINLKRSPERRVLMEKQLNELQLPFRLLEATDNPPSETNVTTLLSSGERGCADSHRRAQSDFLESEAELCLIMEDDLDISPGFKDAIAGILSTPPDERSWDYLQFDYAAVGIKGVKFWWFSFGNLFRKRKRDYLFWLSLPFFFLKGLAANIVSIYEGVRDYFYRENGRSRIVRLYRDRYLAGCYLVNKKAAKYMVEINSPLTMAADAVHNKARADGLIRHYLYVPRLVRQKRESFVSLLDNQHFGKNVISY